MLVKNKSAGKRAFQHISFNAAVSKAKVKIKELEGRKHYVVPMVMLVEGVHQGNKGPLYYPEEELAHATSAWDHKPIVVYHPDDDMTACRPEVLNNQKVGIILNTEWDDGKLRAEAWLDKNRVEEVDKRITDSLKSGKVMELSTGLYTENEKKKGVWNGEKYVGIARNYRPDHLALLPDRRGACSVSDGAGLLRNEMSFSNITGALRENINKKFGYDAYVADVYDGFFVYSRDSRLYKMEYDEKNESIELKGDPEEVVRVTEYRDKEGEFIGNASFPLTEDEVPSKNGNRVPYSKKPGGSTMPAKTKTRKKKEIVESLISNSHTKWEEKHRKYLMNRSERELEMMEPVINDDDEDKVKAPLIPDGGRPGRNKDNKVSKDLDPEKREAAEAAAEEEEAEFTAQRGKKAPPSKQSAEERTNNEDTLTADKWWKTAPPEVRSFYERGRRQEMKLRDKCIATITGNASNKFSEDRLKKMETEELENLAALCAPAREERQSDEFDRNFFGNEPSFVDNDFDDEEEESLPLPVMNFGGDSE